MNTLVEIINNPIAILFTGGLLTLFGSLFVKNSRNILFAIACLTILGALASVVGAYAENQPPIHWQNMLVFDKLSYAFSGTVLTVSLLLMLLSYFAFRDLSSNLGEHYTLILFSLCGAICLVSFDNMVMLFLGIEIMSIPVYVLAASRRENLASNEAGMKYYLMGSFASAILLFGIALVYGATQKLDVTGIAYNATIFKGMAFTGFFKIGVILMLAAMAFKVAAAPFHFWAPDVYQGSPSLVTAYMSTIVKTAAFGALIRLMFLFLGVMDAWAIPVAVIAAITMLLGNISALWQGKVKRMLAYSSVAHAGYLLLGLLALKDYPPAPAASAMMIYLLSYGIATAGIFSVYILVNQYTGKDDFSGFKGLGRTQPVLAVCLAICMMSLAGLPPLAGFFGKYFLFSMALKSFPLVVGAAVLSSAISIYYYFRIITVMFFTKEEEELPAIKVPAMYTVVMVLAVIALLAISAGVGLLMQIV